MTALSSPLEARRPLMGRRDADAFPQLYEAESEPVLMFLARRTLDAELSRELGSASRRLARVCARSAAAERGSGAISR